MTEHKLARLSSTRAFGDPYEGCYAVCTCGVETLIRDSLRDCGESFDAHLRASGVDPLTVRVPWRER